MKVLRICDSVFSEQSPVNVTAVGIDHSLPLFTVKSTRSFCSLLDSSFIL